MKGVGAFQPYNTDAGTETNHNLSEFSEFEYLEIRPCGSVWISSANTVKIGSELYHMPVDTLFVKNKGNITVNNVSAGACTLAVRGAIAE